MIDQKLTTPSAPVTPEAVDKLIADLRETLRLSLSKMQEMRRVALGQLREGEEIGPHIIVRLEHLEAAVRSCVVKVSEEMR